MLGSLIAEGFYYQFLPWQVSQQTEMNSQSSQSILHLLMQPCLKSLAYSLRVTIFVLKVKFELVDFLSSSDSATKTTQLIVRF